MEIKTTEEIHDSIEYMFTQLRKEIPEDETNLKKKWVALDDVKDSIEELKIKTGSGLFKEKEERLIHQLIDNTFNDI